MNTRDYKLFRSGHYYHVYNRGNNKEPIFLDDQDYINFLKRLKLALALESPKTTFGTEGRNRRTLRIRAFKPSTFSVICYCLMPNHYHFLIRQNTSVGIGELIHKVSTSYVKYFNLKYERIGNLFQDAFKAKIVENDNYLKYLSAYIHNNPNKPFEYKYSSLSEYLGLNKLNICQTELILKDFDNDFDQYKKFVQNYAPEHEMLINNLILED